MSYVKLVCPSCNSKHEVSNYYIKANNITSLENLGWNYFSGKHIGIDRVESYAWFNLAAVSSDDKPILWAKSYVANHLSVDELIEAKLRAKQIFYLYNFKK